MVSGRRRVRSWGLLGRRCVASSIRVADLSGGIMKMKKNSISQHCLLGLLGFLALLQSIVEGCEGVNV